MGPLISQRNNGTARKYLVFNDLDGPLRAVRQNASRRSCITADLIGQLPSFQRDIRHRAVPRYLTPPRRSQPRSMDATHKQA